MEGDIRYLRGYATVGSEGSEACTAKCAPGTECTFTCSSLQANVNNTEADRMDHLLAFEICEYAPGPQQDRTWANYYVPNKISGAGAPNKVRAADRTFGYILVNRPRPPWGQMCAPYQLQLRVSLRHEVLKQRMGSTISPSTIAHYWCGAASYIP